MTALTPNAIYQIDDDTVTLVGPHLAHVSSKSHPGMLYAVTDCRCSCVGFRYRSRCRHLDAVRAARALANPPLAVVIPDPLAPDDPNRFAVLWDGYQHGGTHFNRPEAEAHAAELNAAPAWDLMGWRSLHAPVRTHTVNGVEVPVGFER